VTRDEFVKLVDRATDRYDDGAPDYGPALLAAFDAQAAGVESLRTRLDHEHAGHLDALHQAKVAEAEAERLTRERDEALASSSERGAVIANVSGALADCGGRIGDAFGFANEIRLLGRALDEAREALKRIKAVLDDGRLSSHRVLNQIDNIAYAALSVALNERGTDHG